jgi:hypothetical protein
MRERSCRCDYSSSAVTSYIAPIGLIMLRRPAGRGGPSVCSVSGMTRTASLRLCQRQPAGRPEISQELARQVGAEVFGTKIRQVPKSASPLAWER